MNSMSSILNADIISRMELNIKSLASLTRTCKVFSTLMENDSIWETLARKIILNPPDSIKTPWKEYLKENLSIKLQALAPDLKGNSLPFFVEIAQNEITLRRVPGIVLYRADNKMLDEVFKCIKGSFTMVQEGEDTTYYYRDPGIRNGGFYFEWSDKNIRHFSIGRLSKKYNSTTKTQSTWLEQFNACKNKPGTRNFTFRILDSFQGLNKC
jgi:hypothetical protein